MGAQKKGRERAYFAFELSSYGVSIFSFVGGILFQYCMVPWDTGGSENIYPEAYGNTNLQSFKRK